MKKNLAKKVTLSILAGAMLMSSSVAWADSSDQSLGVIVGLNSSGNVVMTSFYVGPNNMGSDSGSVRGDYSIAIGASATVGGASVEQSYPANNAVAVGHNAHVGGAIQNDGLNGVAIGASAYVHGSNNVALGYGSYAGTESNVVSVGSGDSNDDYGTRRIINVTKGEISETSNEVVVGSQLYETNSRVSSIETLIESDYYNKTQTDGRIASAVNNKANEIKDDITGYGSYSSTNYVTIGDTLTSAVGKLDYQIDKNADAIAKVYTKEESDARYMKIAVSDNVDVNVLPTIKVDNEGQMIFGENSSWIGKNGSGFFAGRTVPGGAYSADNANAAIKDTGEIIGAAGKFKVDADGNVTAKSVTAGNLYTKEEIDQKLGGSNASISGINQRLDKTNAKINKVGAGAAALAALHPLEYDPDDKLTFSAGMGNYAGENAAALGAFYRPNEKFMVSLGGTMGNGENMVNLGLSIGLDKPNGYAKLSKRELIQEVNAVKAENEAIKADNEAMKAEMAEMKAMLQAILAKK